MHTSAACHVSPGGGDGSPGTGLPSFRPKPKAEILSPVLKLDHCGFCSTPLSASKTLSILFFFFSF